MDENAVVNKPQFVLEKFNLHQAGFSISSLLLRKSRNGSQLASWLLACHHGVPIYIAREGKDLVSDILS